ncbi:hypothetical protein [Massilia aquatica]|uniref:Uncharacterized protein n=1 Tax=Massilia aquatica TaxID=2609000 RepID=A0ABX0MCJ3_9BURK|nr:hypothetical protein [Massilia aquatica]NHZ44393.1 hypothetical protein [Massilia aquatica]
MIDHVRYSYFDFLNRSKKTAYREAVTMRAKALMTFLSNNGLILIDPFKENGELKDDLVACISNLTPKGVAILNEPVAKWWSFVESGGDTNDISILNKSLEKMRYENSSI